MTEPLPPLRATHTFTTAAGTWWYDTWGVHGRPVVLLPGVLFDRAVWWPAAADLRPYATVVAVDLPGHGQSTPRACYDPGVLVDELAALVDSLRVRRAPVVVGHGSSALLATLFADRFATHAVVVVDPPAPGALTGGVGAYLRAMDLGAIPASYRGMVEVRHDPGLLTAYVERLPAAGSAAGLRVPGLAVHSSVPVDPVPGVPHWRRRVYEVPGGFAHLTATRRFVTDLRELL
jgi:pimeloyl-ACP methyl ester carboxylesterase